MFTSYKMFLHLELVVSHCFNAFTTRLPKGCLGYHVKQCCIHSVSYEAQVLLFIPTVRSKWLVSKQCRTTIKTLVAIMSKCQDRKEHSIR